MSKHTLSREISKELKKLNERIDRSIIKGRPYQEDAQRHRELLAAMRHLTVEAEVPVVVAEVRRAPAVGKVGRSPVRRSLGGGSFLRLFRFAA